MGAKTLKAALSVLAPISPNVRWAQVGSRMLRWAQVGSGGLTYLTYAQVGSGGLMGAKTLKAALSVLAIYVRFD